MTIRSIKRALLSVSDKTGIVEFAQVLHRLNIEIISTGGTSKELTQVGIPHLQVEELTGFPEIFSGRVKTLHPYIHGGILGKRDQHEQEKTQHGLQWIDLVVVNFYPFLTQVRAEMDWATVVEYIDIGGPTMVRAAAKNFAWVSVLTDPQDYAEFAQLLDTSEGITLSMRQSLAKKAFAMTAQYDAAIYQYFSQNEIEPEEISLSISNKTSLRYGENPHQKAWAYRIKDESGILTAKQLQGKPLSYNNLLDADAALACVEAFTNPAAVIVKHANPCGVAMAETIEKAYVNAYQADSLSAFGGIVALNRSCSKEIAEAIVSIFIEVIIAPDFSEEALTLLAQKPNLRVLVVGEDTANQLERRFIRGGLLVQEKDNQQITQKQLNIVTQQKPSPQEVQDMLFAWQVVKHIKSNAILLAKDCTTLGIGAGQVSRVDAVLMAIQKAGKAASLGVLASDGFFPFRDSIDYIAKAGIRAIIQPGGSMRDQEVIAACNEHQIAMAFTGIRCFKH